MGYLVWVALVIPNLTIMISLVMVHETASGALSLRRRWFAKIGLTEGIVLLMQSRGIVRRYHC